MASGGIGRKVKDLSVTTKITAAVLLVGLLLGAVQLFTITRMASIADAATAIKTVGVDSIADLGVMRRQTLAVRLAVANLASAETTADNQKYQAAYTEAQAELVKQMDAYASRTVDPAQFAKVRESWDGYSKVAETVLIPLAMANDVTGFNKARDGKSRPLTQAATDGLSELQDAEFARAQSLVDTASSTYSTARTLAIAMLLLALLLAVGLGMMVARSIAKQIHDVQVAVEAMAKGDLRTVVTVTSHDEVGRMAESLNEAQAQLRGTIEEITQSANALAAAAEELTAASGAMAEASEEAGAQAAVAASAAEQVSASVQTVASGTEEMSASIQEISSNATAAADVAANAVRIANTTNTTVSELGRSSQEIGDVIKTIKAIAEQTNLLALNATIEAARAGDAGKGFAVVAGEVKELAQETARATEDIANRVKAIQHDADEAATAIHEISDVITSINDYQVTIASAVEEQTATSGEITRNLAEASTGTSQIAGNATAVAGAAQSASTSADQTRRAAAELAEMSASMQQSLATFRV